MKLTPVHSRVHCCREAGLFRQKGESRMTCLHDGDRDRQYYRLSINGKLLMDATVWSISTMGAALRVGYGDGIADAVSPSLNGTYRGLEAAAQALAPVTALLNPRRIRHYMDVLETCPAHQAPRAVALYANGAVALLLDGHHKVAAAAALGRRVRTLVIFPVGQLSAATVIPPDRIKRCMRALSDEPWQDWPHAFSRGLAAFSQVFPDSPMLTDRDRARLEKEKCKL